MGETKLAHDRISAARTGIQDRSHHSRSAAAKLGFGLVANRKSLTGAAHPDRNASLATFVVCDSSACAQAILSSVSIQEQELIGNFANKVPHLAQTPTQVNLHDFTDALGRAVPYGIYDIPHNLYVLGNSYDTPEFAVHAIAQWWADPARPRFQREDKILILCDAGGSNNVAVPGSKT